MNHFARYCPKRAEEVEERCIGYYRPEGCLSWVTLEGPNRVVTDDGVTRPHHAQAHEENEVETWACVA
jgi:hypothetical protein